MSQFGLRDQYCSIGDTPSSSTRRLQWTSTLREKMNRRPYHCYLVVSERCPHHHKPQPSRGIQRNEGIWGEFDDYCGKGGKYKITTTSRCVWVQMQNVAYIERNVDGQLQSNTAWTGYSLLKQDHRSQCTIFKFRELSDTFAQTGHVFYAK